MSQAVWVVMFSLFGVGALAGFFMHRSDFCLASAFRDLFLFRSATLIRSLVLLIVLNTFLFEAVHQLGFLHYYPFPWFGPPSLANLLGGILFGLGMVLAGGCVVGVLYKMGGGSLMAIIAFIGLLLGSALYAEIHPWWADVLKASVLIEQVLVLPQWLGVPSWSMVLVFSIAGGLVCWRWWRAGLFQSLHAAEGFVPQWQTAVILSIVSLVSVLVAGLPIGVTTTYAKIAAMLEYFVWPEHVATLSYFQSEPARLALPYEGLLRKGGAGPQFDVVAIVQAPLIIGVVSGAFVSAQQLGEFHWKWKVPGRQVAMVFFGGVIMALGARMTPGCNVWHIMGGLPLLTMQSILFLLGLLPGAWLGSKLLHGVLVNR